MKLKVYFDTEADIAIGQWQSKVMDNFNLMAEIPQLEIYKVEPTITGKKLAVYVRLKKNA